MEKTIFLFFILISHSIGASIDNNPQTSIDNDPQTSIANDLQTKIPAESNPVLVMDFSENQSVKDTRYYKVTHWSASKNYLMISFKQLENFTSSVYGRFGNHHRSSSINSTCFLTSSWEKDVYRNFLPDGSDSISFIFKRNSLGPRPYPFPLPLPFRKVQNSSSRLGKEYKMESIEYGGKNDRIISKEVIVVEFMTVDENVSSRDVYKEGFTNFIPCSDL